MQQHQGQQPFHLRLRRQIEQQPRQANRLAREVGPCLRIPGRRRVAFVEHQIDHAQDAVQTFRPFARRRHLVGNPCVADFRLCANDALCERWRGGQKSAGDFLGFQPAHFTERQRHLRLGRQCRMTTGKDETQTIILDLVAAILRFVGDGLHLAGHIVQRSKTR